MLRIPAMIVFYCNSCDRNWTKLIDDVCHQCGLPCEVIELGPSQNKDRPGRAYGYCKQPTGLYRQEHINDSNTDHYKPRRIFDFDLEGEFPRLLNTVATASSIIEENPLSSRRPDLPASGVQYQTDVDFRKASHDSAQSSLHSPLFTDSSDIESAVLPRLQAVEINNEGRKGPQLAERSLLVNLHDATSGEDQQRSTTYRQSPVLTPITSNASKKKKKKSGKQESKQNAGTQETVKSSEKKLVAQLELPEPITSPKPPTTTQAWNEIVDKKALKRRAKVKAAAHGGVMINASSHLVRQQAGDENKVPTARVVRFGMGGAKHDVKSTVPREIFEF